MILLAINKLRQFKRKSKYNVYVGSHVEHVVTGFKGRTFIEAGYVYGVVKPDWIIENVFNGFRDDKNKHR